MADCEKLATCAFFIEYEKDVSKKLALEGFAKMFCRGDKQDDCVRKKVSNALGGPEHVPVNMMPNGRALSGTSDSDWSEQVISAMK